MLKGDGKEFIFYLSNLSITRGHASGWWLFDEEKYTAVPGCFHVMLWLFLLTFFTFCYF
jgi:hypothetical protein